MNKTLLYVMAVAGLIASGAAVADSGNVEVYGTLDIDLENVKASSAGGAELIQNTASYCPSSLGVAKIVPCFSYEAAKI
ncbi:MAG: hypothetical protein ACREVA_00990 [Burkholderiales bacterium]